MTIQLPQLVDPSSIHLLIAAILGSIMGLEREFARKDPSLRTFMLICLGSCIFSIISIDAAQGSSSVDPSRIAAQIVVGIGFLGAGAIFRSRERITGLTTAALMWVTAAIGMAVGFNRLGLAFTASVLVLSFMTILGFTHGVIRKITRKEQESESLNANSSDSDEK